MNLLSLKNLVSNKFNFFKYLTSKKKTRKPGLDNKGRRVIRTRGAGLSRLNRKIDFLHSLWHQKCCITSVDYDPNTKKLISLMLYINGCYAYDNFVIGSYVGMTTMSSHNSTGLLGSAMFIQNFLYGANISSLELLPKSGAKLLRAGGSFGKALNSKHMFRLVKLKSGKLLDVPFDCAAINGIISDFFHLYHCKKKNAGYYRILGWRPLVRGVAMNSVDHPHGGGKGKKSGNVFSMSPWGALPKGKKTR